MTTATPFTEESTSRFVDSKPWRFHYNEVGEGHPGSTGAGCEILRMITQREDSEPEGARGQHGRGSCLIDIGSGACPRDPDPGEMVKRVLQGLLTEVESVVVGKADAVEPSGGRARRPRTLEPERRRPCRVRPTGFPARRCNTPGS